MKAKITKVETGLIPLFDNIKNEDVPTVVVMTTVEFHTDDEPSVMHFTQNYACKPEDFPADNYQGQADSMQADIDHAKVQAVVDAQNAAANAKVAEIQSLIAPQ